MSTLNPNEHQLDCQKCLSRFWEGRLRLVHAEPPAKSMRRAPWRLDVEVEEVAQLLSLADWSSIELLRQV